MAHKRGTGTNKEFEIISVCKEDILSLQTIDEKGNEKSLFNKTDILKLTESDMKRIASKLASDYTEQLFWSSLPIIVESVLGLKKRNL